MDRESAGRTGGSEVRADFISIFPVGVNCQQVNRLRQYQDISGIHKPAEGEFDRPQGGLPMCRPVAPSLVPDGAEYSEHSPSTCLAEVMS